MYWNKPYLSSTHGTFRLSIQYLRLREIRLYADLDIRVRLVRRTLLKKRDSSVEFAQV